MKRGRSWWVLVASLAVAACGGGSEVVAILGSLGAGGGNWFVDADTGTSGYQPRTNCGPGGAEVCVVNINPGTLYERNYAVTGGGNFPGCDTSPTGTVTDAVNVSIPGCFVGRFLSVNEALSTDGKMHMYFDFFPDLATGVWVDINDDGHRFVFNGSASGCEITGATKRALTLTIEGSNFGDFAAGNVGTLVSETVIPTLTIEGPPSRTFSGQFVGASGLRLTRSGETIELQRHDQTGNCN
jgi:hypothetical protein